MSEKEKSALRDAGPNGLLTRSNENYDTTRNATTQDTTHTRIAGCLACIAQSVYWLLSTARLPRAR